MRQVYIVVTGDRVGELVGTFDHRPKRLANGDFVKIEAYPELFQKIGYTFGPPPYKYTEPSFIKRYFLGVKPRRYRNPDFRPGWFKLPDALHGDDQPGAHFEGWPECKGRDPGPASDPDGLLPDEPIPTILHCPECKALHVDEGEWATRPHKTHQCQKCGHEWRPYSVPTVGIHAPDEREIAALREDAERYHFLISIFGADDDDLYNAIDGAMPDEVRNDKRQPTKAEMDIALDAARLRAGKG